MKAWIIEEQKPVEKYPLKLVEIPDPHPGPGQIRIKVVACGVCRTDAHIAEGDLPLHKRPVVPGHEIVGIVDEIGEGVKRFKIGDRAGVTWLNYACGTCKYCRAGKENICENAKFTGWDVDGGYAEYHVVDERFALHLPEDRSFEELAPWMCPGVAGYRAFKLTGLSKGQKLGLYGFGPSATYILQVAKHLGIEVFVITRSEKNKEAAMKLGADWVGGYEDKLPVKLDGSILFPPVGKLVAFALSQLDKGGRLVLGPVTMTPVVIDDYDLLWHERHIVSLANVSREDGKEFIEIASKIDIKMDIEVFTFEGAPEALIKTRHSKQRGTAVLKIVET